MSLFFVVICCLNSEHYRPKHLTDNTLITLVDSIRGSWFLTFLSHDPQRLDFALGQYNIICYGELYKIIL